MSQSTAASVKAALVQNMAAAAAANNSGELKLDSITSLMASPSPLGQSAKVVSEGSPVSQVCVSQVCWVVCCSSHCSFSTKSILHQRCTVFFCRLTLDRYCLRNHLTNFHAKEWQNCLPDLCQWGNCKSQPLCWCSLCRYLGTAEVKFQYHSSHLICNWWQLEVLYSVLSEILFYFGFS